MTADPVWLEPRTSPVKGPVSSGLCLTSWPRCAAGTGLSLQAGETRALHPSRASALSGRAGSPCCPQTPIVAWDAPILLPEAACPVFQASLPSLGFLWPRGTPEAPQRTRSRKGQGRRRPLRTRPRSGGTMGELCSQTARPYKSCPGCLGG